MIRKLTFLAFLFFSINSFSQTDKCSEGTLSFYKNEGKTFHNGSLAKDGFLLPQSNLQELFTINNLSDQFKITALNENDLEIIHIGTESKLSVSIDILDTKANLMLCLEEFTDKLTFFFLSGSNEVIFNSTIGIPFLTFSRIE